jgi:DNA polymerase III delta subunit
MAKNRYDDLFDDADAAFNGQYKDALNNLYGLSKDEIDSIVPGTAGLQTYAILIKVVEQASKQNLTQTQLVKNIKDLGDLAIKIAKKIPEFAALL